MKTANQERLSSVCRALNLNELQRAIVERLINQDLKEAQLDAMKEGMRRAAKMCNDQWQQMEVPAERLQIYYAEKGILSAAEQLTEKDL